jgi:hypothetical protein
LLRPSEEVTKTWIKRKGILIKSRPEPSRFSFVVCLSIVLSIAFGFLGGFITAGFALSENYSSVYESLLAELDNTRRCIDREKELLLAVKYDQNRDLAINQASVPAPSKPTNQLQEQAIFSVFGHAINLLSKNDKTGGCVELNDIIKDKNNSEKWKNKALQLINNNCK